MCVKGEKGGRKGGVQIYISKRVHIEKEKKRERERVVQDRKKWCKRERSAGLEVYEGSD